MSSLVERAPADFLADVAHPLNIEAELRVLDYLRNRRGWPTLDVRSKRKPWDMECFGGGGIMRRLEVKADHYLDDTANVPFEHSHVYRDGHEEAGWGQKQQIDIVAVVAVKSWRCIFVRLPELRALVEREQAGFVAKPLGWKLIDRENLRGGYRTKGWAIPITDAWKAMAIFLIVELPEAGF